MNRHQIRNHIEGHRPRSRRPSPEECLVAAILAFVAAVIIAVAWWGWC